MLSKVRQTKYGQIRQHSKILNSGISKLGVSGGPGSAPGGGEGTEPFTDGVFTSPLYRGSQNWDPVEGTCPLLSLNRHD